MYPTRQEFREKVVEYMHHFELTLNTFPTSTESEKFKNYARGLLERECELVLKGENKDVEKRYIYFISSK